MLIEFTVENFLSFRERATLSMVATSRSELLYDATFESQTFRMLKSAVIYGANASGKSNLYKAMHFMRKFTMKSVLLQSEIDVTPFLFSTITDNKPSIFEMVFIQNGTQYRYGFSVDKKKVYGEWLFHVPTKIETILFIREGNKLKESSGKFKEADELIAKTRPDALLLTVAAQFNSKIALNIIKWFRNFNPISGFQDYYPYTLPYIKKHPECLDRVIEIIQAADIGIEKLNIREREIPWEDVPEEIRIQVEPSGKGKGNFMIVEVDALHKKYNAKGKPIDLQKISFQKFESQGTRRILSILGPILDTLLKGKILFIDELEIGLHPLLSQLLIRLFNTKEHNPNNAQLILTTHNTHLINIDYFRRDQIWFMEKDRFGGTKLYSLSEFRKRKDASLQKDYLQGRFGAIPIIQEDLLNKLGCEN